MLNYNIKNFDNISDDSIIDEMMSSDLIITKRGKLRDSISFLGESMFIDKSVIELSDDVENVLNTYQEKNEKTKVAIDISLIDRKSLADLFSMIAKLALKHHYEICVIYSLARYAPPSDHVHPNSIVKPVSHFFSGWSSQPGMPVLSVVGLGYEKDKAIGAIEYLESSKAFLYVPTSNEEEYFDDVVNENAQLLDQFGLRNRFIYKLESPTEAIYSLDTVISANKNKYKIVLLPFGPKIFYALSLLSSIPHPEVSVWYVSGESGDGDSSQDRSASSLIGFRFDISAART
ncbi:transcription elongation factor GreB [Vibrio genomosp. F6]|uniref:transcription elongation factor GreB n=1 Tax=Vibrio genomosp. F6 TaxID=723172 RepID=UPI0010BDC788|nr:transcription elongation factor GreB [Vibrio genomosp. F6]TKF23243.1 transcription elongation factor GreB [Vibrio genomosp. F6]